ncbi:hypothetical protein [Burkholderia sp. Se-20378]|uniref:hypothetical protein n=1 Tax=Burkholderia sp. Se-20378 TaxID=2703899 RepID=UPI00197EDD19|nr:hypothetical protein [Burkholderia sp. Se-20378]MBN3769080.1 hypothetical protein [Burkholderia sp. Se-20378]
MRPAQDPRAAAYPRIGRSARLVSAIGNRGNRVQQADFAGGGAREITHFVDRQRWRVR